MKCSKCQTKNINQANYCKKCGNEFTEKERKTAVRWTPVWILEKIEKGISIVKGDFRILGIITDTKVFKVISLLVVLGVGVGIVWNNGMNVQIKESENYNVQFNTEANEYYVFVKEKETTLNVYVPNDVDKMILKHCDEEGDVLDENELSREDEIVLQAQDDDYYTLKIEQGKKETELKLFVYLGASSDEKER